MENGTQIQTFTNTEFGELKTIQMNNEIWFIGKDVVKILGYANVSKTLKDHVDEDDKQKGVTIRYSRGGNQKPVLINESGLYSLMLSSKLPSAKKFKKWITSEVLPSIRKTGAYMTPETIQSCLSNPDVMIEILQTLKNEQEKRKQLETENQNLLQENKALAKDINTWDNRAILNALIRSLGYKKFKNKISFAWNTYYKALLYKSGINLRGRAKQGALLDAIKENEWQEAISVAVALCKENGIDVCKVINEVNSKLVSF